MAQSLDQAAAEGPNVLTARLRALIDADPGLVATPGSAAALADAAATPVPGYIGAKVPVYRDIVAAISAGAPEARRDEIVSAASEAVARVAASDPQLSPRVTRELEQRIQEAPSGPPGLAEAPARAQGIRLGNMVLLTEAQATEYYDSNIFATETNEESDFVTVFSPAAYLVSDWERHAVSVQAHLDKVWYKDNKNENSTDYWFSGEGRLDATDDLQFYGGASFGRFHEDRASPDDVNGIEPTKYYERKLYGAAWQRLGDHQVRAGATWEDIRFKDTPTTIGPINNTDRNRDHVTTGIADFFRLNETFTPYVEFGYDKREYHSAFDDTGLDRDSHGYRPRIGTEFRVPGELDGEVYVGYMRQEYQDRTFSTIDEIDFGGNFRWRFRPTTQLSGWVSRSIEETTLFPASGYVLTGAGLRLEQDITSDLLLTLRSSYYASDYKGSTRWDEEYEAGGGLRYNVNAYLYVAADYRFQARESTTAGSSYDRHQVFFRVGAQY